MTENETNPVAAPAADAPAATGGSGAPPTDAGEDAAADLAVVEAMLYAAGKPVAPDKMAEAAEVSVERIEAALATLDAACGAAGRGVRLDRVAGGVRLVSRVEHDYPVRRLLGLDGKAKLSIAGLETLAIVAYRQPITAPEIAELRGVSSASSIRTLLDRKLITTAGRKEVVGTPFLYKTTKEFLVHFGLADLAELPKPEELEALYGVEAGPDPKQPELFTEDDMSGDASDGGEPSALGGLSPSGAEGDERTGSESGGPPDTTDAAESDGSPAATKAEKAEE